MSENPPFLEILAAILGFLLLLGALFALSGCAQRQPYRIIYDDSWEAETLEEAPKHVQEYYRALSGEPIFGL